MLRPAQSGAESFPSLSVLSRWHIDGEGGRACKCSFTPSPETSQALLAWLCYPGLPQEGCDSLLLLLLLLRPGGVGG